MRHRKTAGDDLAAGHVDQYAAIPPPVAPAVGYIRAAYRGNERGTGAIHRQSVQVAPVLRHQGGNKFWSPQRSKTCGFADGRQATIQRIDEDRSPRAVYVTNPDVVGVDPANDATFEGNKLAVRSRLGRLALVQHILEPPEHVEPAGPQRLTVGPQALTLLDDALMGAHATIVPAADEEQPAGLIGGERHAHIRRRQPVGEARRQQQHRPPVDLVAGWGLAHVVTMFAKPLQLHMPIAKTSVRCGAFPIVQPILRPKAFREGRLRIYQGWSLSCLKLMPQAAFLRWLHA